jgi:hypothetical protein
MVRVSAREFKQEMPEILNRTAYQGERPVIHHRGKGVAINASRWMSYGCEKGLPQDLD